MASCNREAAKVHVGPLLMGGGIIMRSKKFPVVAAARAEVAPVERLVLGLPTDEVGWWVVPTEHGVGGIWPLLDRLLRVLLAVEVVGLLIATTVCSWV